MATILVVDDGLVDRKLLVTLLGHSGHRTLEAPDGEVALDLTLRHLPDLIITDILMPRMDGYEFVRRVRSDSALERIPVLFYTGAFHEQAARSLAMACGATQLLLKPAETELISRTVDALLDQRRASDPPPEATPAREDRAAGLLSDTLLHGMDALETVNGRLATLIDTGMALATERDAERLLARCAEAARRLLDAHYVVVGLPGRGPAGRPHFVTSGLADEAAAARQRLEQELRYLDTAAMERRVVRGAGHGGEHLEPWTSDAHLAAGSSLAVPIASPDNVYGWLYCASRPWRPPFAPMDESLAIMLAAQVAVAYENALKHDMIARHAAELESHVTVAREALRLRDEFLSIAAHELRTPVTSLRGFAQIVLRQLDAKGAVDPELLRRASAAIERETGRLTRLIAQLLDVARIEAGKLALERQVTDLVPLVQAGVERARVRTTHHTIHLHAPEALPAFVDPLRLEQVLTNLLDNAIKYSPDGGPIDVDLSHPVDGTVQLDVLDRGMGIPPERRAQIFDRFYQAHRDSHRSGMGLGLFICRQIVELHGGQITPEFPLDGGTRFVVTLPRQGCEQG